MYTSMIILLASCTSKLAGDSAVPEEPLPAGEDQTVAVFVEEYVHFGEENRRIVDVPITFPDDTATYSQITGRFALTCPNDRCDWWDRFGSFGVVLDAGTKEEVFIELDRFITPYRVGFSWSSDLTVLRPMLTGEQTMRVYIDTWVSEGHENGDGWLFTAELDFTGGPPPSPQPIANVPVWGFQSWSAGLSDNPTEAQVVPQEVSLPAHTSSAFRAIITGHGWNNQQNCAEFCAKEHFFTVGAEEFGQEVWREDCDETETDGRQQGSWQYARAGWCPGAQVYPWDTDTSAQTVGQDSVPVSYRLENFTWRGDGDQPYYYHSGLIILYAE